MMSAKRNMRTNGIAVALAGLCLWLVAEPARAQTGGNVTWTNGGTTVFWNDPGNWVGGQAPANPTTGQVLLDANLTGQSVTGKLEAARTIGSLRMASGWDAWGQTPRGQRHTIDLNGYRLTIAGNLDTDNAAAHRYLTFIGGGVVQFGNDSAEGSLQLYGLYGGNGVVTFVPGTTLDSYRMGTLRVGSTDQGSNRGWHGVDLRGAAVAGGLLTVKNLYITTKSGQDVGLMFDGTTSLDTLVVTNELDFGDSAASGGNAYIGNPSTLKLPANVNVQVGNGSTARGNRLRIGRGATSAQLTASSGGWFKAYVTDLTIGDVAYNGTLDIRAMTNCAIEAVSFTVCKESGNPAVSPQAQARLCPGTVTAGTVALGSTVSGGYGLLEMSNTLFTVTNTYTLNTTATNLISVGSDSLGLDVQGAFADGGGRIRVRFMDDPAVGVTNWAVRVKGNAKKTLGALVGSGRIVATQLVANVSKKIGYIYAPAADYSYYALVDASVPFEPLAIAKASLSYELAPGGTVLVGTNDINNGSFDPAGRTPVAFSVSTNGIDYAASVAFDTPGDYTVTFKMDVGSPVEASDTDTCAIRVTNVNPGVTGNLTWKGGASSYLMDRPEWMWSGNWLEGTPPTNPTTATIYYKTAGQSYVGKIETPRTIGGISIGVGSWDTVTHTLDLGGTVLTLAGNMVYSDIAYPTLALTNGTLRIGSAAVEGNITVGGGNYGSASLLCRAGAIIETYRVGTLRAGRNTGSNAQYGWMDLRNASFAGGVLGANNIVVGARGTSYIALDNTTTIGTIAVSNSLLVGETSYGGLGYIGNPADANYRMPSNVSLRVGSGPAGRGSIQIGSGGGGALTAVMSASSGGAFTAWLTSLLVMPAGDPTPGIATFDLAGMTNCAVDAQVIRVASGGAGVDLRGTLKLPPGAVTAGTVEIGTTNGAAAAIGLLVTSNTAISVTNTLALNKTAVVTNLIHGVSSGFDVSKPEAVAVTVESGAKWVLRFLAPASAIPHYGLRWKGSHVAELQAMRDDGRLVVDSSGLGKTASIYYAGGFTGVGLPPSSGTLILVK